MSDTEQEESKRLVSQQASDGDVEEGLGGRCTSADEASSTGRLHISFKTTLEKVVSLDVDPKSPVSEVRRVLLQHAGELNCDVTSSRLLYHGRFLEDAETLESLGIQSGHTILVVPKSTSPVAASLSLEQQQDEEGTSGASGESSAGREHMELVLGIFFGFMLGWLALLCFCENRASKRFWHGLCIGMALSVIFAILQYRIPEREEHGHHH